MYLPNGLTFPSGLAKAATAILEGLPAEACEAISVLNSLSLTVRSPCARQGLKLNSTAKVTKTTIREFLVWLVMLTSTIARQGTLVL
jgi:hypothetical protein